MRTFIVANLPVDGHLDYFSFFATVNSAAKGICMVVVFLSKKTSLINQAENKMCRRVLVYIMCIEENNY